MSAIPARLIVPAYSASVNSVVQLVEHFLHTIPDFSSMEGATNSLEPALAVLEIVVQTPGGLRNADISRRMRIPKSTCSYILARLERRGYLTKNYVLIIDRVEGFDFVRDVVQIADGSPASWNRRTTHYPVREDRDIGRELPPHSTAVGKVLMAWLPRPAVMELLEQRGLPRRTRKTITSKANFLQELELVRKQGYAQADGEYSVGLRSIAAPIHNAAGLVSAGVSLNGPVAEAAWNEPEELMQLVKSAAREISRRARFLSDRYGAID